MPLLRWRPPRAITGTCCCWPSDFGTHNPCAPFSRATNLRCLSKRRMWTGSRFDLQIVLVDGACRQRTSPPDRSNIAGRTWTVSWCASEVMRSDRAFVCRRHHYLIIGFRLSAWQPDHDVIDSPTFMRVLWWVVDAIRQTQTIYEQRYKNAEQHSVNIQHSIQNVRLSTQTHQLQYPGVLPCVSDDSTRIRLTSANVQPSTSMDLSLCRSIIYRPWWTNVARSAANMKKADNPAD
jgi:hypothetical protein